MASYFTQKLNLLSLEQFPPSLASIVWLRDQLRKPSPIFLRRNPLDIQVGKLYWTMYAPHSGDKMFTYCPIIPVEYAKTTIGPVYWAIQLNFLPHPIRYQLGDWLTSSLTSNLIKLENDDNPSVLHEPKLNINYEKAISFLKEKGFWWAVRQFPLFGPVGEDMFFRVYEVSWRLMANLFACNIGHLTGVTDEVLSNIWQKKLLNTKSINIKIIEQLQKNGLSNSQLANYWKEKYAVKNDSKIENVLKDIKEKLDLEF